MWECEMVIWLGPESTFDVEYYLVEWLLTQLGYTIELSWTALFARQG